LRITPQEHAATADAARVALAPGMRVGLFGSRVDGSARGGDIELPGEAQAPLSATEWVALRQALTTRPYRPMREGRIDMLHADGWQA
jgi:hypothetical protein